MSTTAMPTTARTLSAVEQRGIEPVPEGERNGNPLQLFWVWFAANISILGLPLGATLIAFQLLNVWQALIVALIGTAGSFALVGVVSIAGRRGGAPSMTLSRAVFGQRGNIGPTIVSLLSRLGWETVNTTTGAFVLLSLFALLFGTASQAKSVPILTLVAIAIFEICTLLVSGLGHAAILVIQKWATWIFGALNVFVAIFLVANVDWNAVAATPAGPISAVIIGIGVIAAGTGIGWANAGADMARYQRTSVKAARLVASSAAGAGIPLVLLIGLGALLTTGDSSLASASDPVAAIRDLLPPWMAVPYLIAAFGGLLLSNHLSVYSAGLTTLTLGLRVKRVYAVGVDVVVTFAGSIYFMLVAGNFYGPFISFISILAVPITAWLGVFLVDMITRRSYDADALMDTGRTSRYWYRGGIEWRAFGSWAIAIIIGFSFATVGSGEDVWYRGWLAGTWLGQNGLAWIVTIVVSGGLYFLSGGARVSNEITVAHKESAHV
ncbi:purine-cytosine permease family protein [Lacisediminihabitans changchengi]|uniref:Cytosine permease n=1 Tax=Lacisediminihabitans changchengi TaxID=2787634 RepID=A0A934SU38_9MICO|nr:cytosine permease [Lacisediminihabitans changchengi]MBK4348950.1 cytosine permease [Lacisediminihabitans changchengi]